MATCSLCCDESKSWAVGSCDHATCLVCSVRLRVLCEQRDCPVCREKMNKVVVAESIKTFSLPPHGSKVDRKYGYFFSNTQLYDKYKSLLLYRCFKCREKPVFSTFHLLRDHSRKTHGLLYCDICCDNLKLFPYELRTYTRQELTRHRREGDPDDKSYKGHPLCQFCDGRFFDNDALHAHLHKVHFWCHFCESDGKQDYYAAYPQLRNHFRLEHYLCVEGACEQEKFTSVFRSKLDLQVHRARAHSKGMSKAEAKQMRQLDVGFTYGRTEEPRGGGGVTNSAAGGRSQWQQVQQRRGPSKSREYDEKCVTVVSVYPQQQHETKSSPNIQRKHKTTVLSTSSAGGAPHNYEQPPRMKLRQEQQKQPPTDRPSAEVQVLSTKTDSNSTDTSLTTAPRAKNPPGFETALQQTAMNTAGTNEWPDLQALAITPKEQPKSVTAPSKPQPPGVSHNPSLWSRAHFPALKITAAACNSNLFPPGSNPDESGAIGTNVPPGFVASQWQTSQKDSLAYTPPVPYNSSNVRVSVDAIPSQSVKNMEKSVIDLVVQALDRDREKFNHFRNLSGWYRNSEITVREYVVRCRQLFGDLKWMVVGPQLAQVMPIEGKRNELLQNVYYYDMDEPLDNPSSLTNPTPSLTDSTAPMHVSRSEPTLLQRPTSHLRWGIGGGSRTAAPNWQSECEYPSLHSQSSTGMKGQLQPPTHSWKARVPV